MDDYYCVDENSDHEVIDTSSDDEDFKSLFTCNESDDEDFETEMERERLNHVNGIHKVMPLTSNQTTTEESDNKTAKNDDLFYDPESDESDQKWVNDQRLVANNRSICASSLSKSDATLNCPSCMSLLCMDCQRHCIYKTQYRAMFVFNCRIDFTQKLQFKDKKSKRNQLNSDNNCIDHYFAVFCKVCNTQVAVYDKDQVYHFFSVLASH